MKSLLISLLTSVVGTLVAHTASAQDAFSKPYGVHEASGGHRTATVFDASATHANPAGLAYTNELYTITPFYQSFQKNSQMYGLALMDTTRSTLRGGAVFRALDVFADDNFDYQLSLGLAEVSQTLWGLPIGLGVDVTWRHNPETDEYDDPSYRGRLGIVYPINQVLFFGLKTEGFFDDVQPFTHSMGLSMQIWKFWVSLDTHFRQKDLERFGGSLSYNFRETLDLSFSYGYENELRAHEWTGGFAFGAISDLQVSYVFRQRLPEEGDNENTHSVGLTWNL